MQRGTAAFTLALILVSLLLYTSTINLAAGSEQYEAKLTEWTVPTAASGISALTLDQSGSCCWFAEYYGNKLGYLKAALNTVEEWPIPTPGANPYDLAVAPTPAPFSLWGTEFGTDRIFGFSSASGSFIEYKLPGAGIGVGYISVEPTGPQTRIWFTETLNNVNGELVYDPTSTNATLYQDYFPSAMGGGAYGLYAQSNAIWFAGFSALAKWDRSTQQYTVWPLPTHGSAIGRFINIDPNGQAWYTQGTQNAASSDNFVGVLRSSGVIEEWKLPSDGADPREISINPQSLQPWIAERSLATGNGAMAVLTNSTDPNIVTTTPMTYPSGGSPILLSATQNTVPPTSNTVTPVVREISGLSKNQFAEFAVGASAPQSVVTDSHGNIWFSEPGTNQIAELSNFTRDFALSTFPTSMSLAQGGSGTVSVIGVPISGYDGDITISNSNLPLGVKSSASANTLVIPLGVRNASIQVELSVSPNANPGTTAIEFEGNDGIIAHTTSFLLTITNSSVGASEKPQCLIATATYGSNLSPQVEQLRSFRDTILKSKLGNSFLLIFNSWYYSFSPYVANYIATHPYSRTVMKSVLDPLLAAIALSSYAYATLSFFPECAVLASGMLASFLIGSIYLGLPLYLVKRTLRISFRMSIRISAFSTFAGLTGLLYGLWSDSSDILMIASSMAVISVIWISGTLTAHLLSYRDPSSKTSTGVFDEQNLHS
jgi:streptogramin lyase